MTSFDGPHERRHAAARHAFVRGNPEWFAHGLLSPRLQRRNDVLLCLEDRESAPQIVGERSRVVEAGRVQPHAARARGPGAFDCLRQEMSTETLAGECREQTEVRDLDAPRAVLTQLEIASKLSRD